MPDGQKDLSHEILRLAFGPVAPDKNGIVTLLDRPVREKSPRQLVDNSLNFPRKTSEAQERVTDSRIVLVGQFGEQIVPNPIPGEPAIRIGAVFPKGLSERSKVLEHVAAPDFQKGANQGHGRTEAARTGHPGQSRDSRSTKDSMKNGLDLIVRGVGTGHIASPHLLGRTCQKAVSAAASRFLEPVGRSLDFPRLPSPPLACDPQPPRQLADELFIPIGLAPSEVVIVVSHDQSPGASMLERSEPTEQGDAVGAS